MPTISEKVLEWINKNTTSISVDTDGNCLVISQEHMQTSIFSSGLVSVISDNVNCDVFKNKVKNKVDISNADKVHIRLNKNGKHIQADISI